MYQENCRNDAEHLIFAGLCPVTMLETYIYVLQKPDNVIILAVERPFAVLSPLPVQFVECLPSVSVFIVKCGVNQLTGSVGSP